MYWFSQFCEKATYRGDFVDSKKKAFVIVDVQKAFDDEKWGERNNLNAEENVSLILKRWREEGWLVIHIQHVSDDPQSLFHPKKDTFAIKELAKPQGDEVVIQKKVNSSFIGTNLKDYLRANDVSEVVIAGLTTPHCVSTTTRMSGNLGFTTYLVSDATAAFGLKDQNNHYYDADTIHNITLATLHEEFATVLTTDELMNDLLS
ncbi:putative isochorismatase family protein YrdC [Sporosarcina sp. NCCP-2716]|nr:putative isochorismatase family protein YrdC [Sporosarcina sp. NCCP-2716]